MNARQVDFQALMDLCRINEESPPERFRLDTFMDEEPGCGTVCCLIGNFCLARPLDSLRIRHGWPVTAREDEDEYDTIATRFGITFHEAEFLFYSLNPRRTAMHGLELACEWTEKRSNGDVAAAIRRVRKLIYWKLKRREFTHDDKGCVRESARRTEGNHGFARQVLAAV